MSETATAALPAMQPAPPRYAPTSSKDPALQKNLHKDFPYWCVRGRVYDLSKFDHPGGPVAMQLAKGRDADDLIRSYHPFSEEKVRAILAKYEVKDVACPYPAVGIFETEDSEFAKDLKQGVLSYFAKTQKDRTADLGRWRDYAIMLSLLLVSTYFLVNGYFLAVPFAPLFWWMFGVNTFHDSSHFAIAHSWRVNHWATHMFPFFSSPTTWYYQHVVGHHPYVNIRGKDPDLNHQSPLHRYAPWHRFKKLHAYQAIGVYVVWILGMTIQSQITDFVCFTRSLYQNVVPMERMSRGRRYLHWFGRIVAFSLVHVWPFFVGFPLWKAVFFAIVPNYIMSALYLSISQAGHIVAETMTLPERDFYRHQIAHTHNFGTDSLVTFWFSGGLNLQVEHHLFPGLNHCHLRALAPMVKEVCRKHGVTYHESSGYFSAVRRHLELIWALSVR
jgi:delta11-fatty-acid desaturase